MSRRSLRLAADPKHQYRADIVRKPLGAQGTGKTERAVAPGHVGPLAVESSRFVGPGIATNVRVNGGLIRGGESVKFAEDMKAGPHALEVDGKVIAKLDAGDKVEIGYVTCKAMFNTP